MSKLITVSGSPGSGKSLFAALLASIIAKEEKQVILVSTDRITPMLPVMVNSQPLDASKSIVNVLKAKMITPALVASQVTLLESCPYIGVLAYPAQGADYTVEALQSLCQIAGELVAYVIVDCSPPDEKVYQPIVAQSNVSVNVLTADRKGLSYYRAHEHISAAQEHAQQQFTFAGMARPFQALDDIGAMIGGWDGYLPYSKNIEQCCGEFDMFSALKHCNDFYLKALTKVHDTIK